VILLVPSRGRPERARSMVKSALTTAAGRVEIILIVDNDDERLPDYLALDDLDHVTVLIMPERIGYSASLNAAARDLWDVDTILGAFGDDVCFLTVGWDVQVHQALNTPGIAYGNDLVHADGHPTAIWMSSQIARALGWLALPASWHLWVDDAWKRLGQETGTLRYLPNVIVEHLHPAVGKAAMDTTYEQVYDGDRAHQDHLGYLDWEQNHLADDAATVRAMLDA
jgi:hypothetical protein